MTHPGPASTGPKVDISPKVTALRAKSSGPGRWKFKEYLVFFQCPNSRPHHLPDDSGFPQPHTHSRPFLGSNIHVTVNGVCLIRKVVFCMLKSFKIFSCQTAFLTKYRSLNLTTMSSITSCYILHRTHSVFLCLNSIPSTQVSASQKSSCQLTLRTAGVRSTTSQFSLTPLHSSPQEFDCWL